MNGTEIIALLSSGVECMKSAVGPVVGALITAIFLRHNTKTDEFEKIKAGKFEEAAELLLSSGKMTYTEFYKAKNFLTIAKKADKYYQDNFQKKVVNNEKYDFDWFVRFYEAVGCVSDDTMQDLWAKILAGEIAQSSTFSIKAIDTLKNLNKKDIELFIRICSYSFNSDSQKRFLPNIDKYLNDVGIVYEDILELSELGLILDNAFLVSEIDIEKKPKIFVRGNKLVMTICSSSGNPMKASIDEFPFTKVGNELSLLTNVDPSLKEYVNYGKLLSDNKSYKISLHNVIENDNNGFCYSNDDLLIDIKLQNQDC